MTSSEQRNLPEDPDIKGIAVGSTVGILGYTLVRPFEQGKFGITPPEIIQGNMWDFIIPIGASYLFKGYGSRSPSVNAATSFLIASTIEALQGFGLHEGTFDLKDVAAYGLGAGTYYAVERFRGRKKVDMQPGEEYSVNPNVDQTPK